MKAFIFITLRKLCIVSLLCCLPAWVLAQEQLQTIGLFDKYGTQKDVTRVELNGSILKSHHMTTYKSLLFKDITSYREEIQQCLTNDKQVHVKKAQEVMESGLLRSAYYQLQEIEKNGKKLQRYLLFKIGKENMGTIIYIEGTLNEQEMMEMLYKQQ